MKYASGVCGPVVVERQQCPNGFYRRYSDSDCERVVVYRECQPGMRKTERGDCVCARPFERVVNGRCETYVVDWFPTCTRPLVYRFSSRSCVYPNIPDPVYPLTDGGNLVDVRPEPEYCGGRTSDGCDMRLEVVPRDGNRAERVCVTYCPRQNPGEPPVETAISTTWTEPTTQGERPIETGISAPAIEPGPKGEPPMPTPVSASTSEPAPAGIRPAQMPASAPFWAEPNSPTKRP